jgi:hypothetical protein
MKIQRETDEAIVLRDEDGNVIATGADAVREQKRYATGTTIREIQEAYLAQARAPKQEAPPAGRTAFDDPEEEEVS